MKWHNMTPAERGATLFNMGKGGTFAQALAALWLVADAYNEDKLAQAFPELIERYHPKDRDKGL